MSDAMQSHLERFPEGAIEVAQGRILDFNRAAQAQFPELAVGMEAPEFLSGSLSDPEGAGTFAHNGSLYLFSRVSGTERDLLLFRPAPQSPLTQGQLDGFVRQMRGFLQDILLEFETVSGPSRGGMDAFSKSFCRIYRLLSNLDFMRSIGAPEGVPFRPVTMDLAGLCRSLTQEAAFLLGEAGVTLTFRCALPSLLIPGDPELLQKLILTLLSNAAKAAPGGQVVLSLSSRSGRAVLTLSDSGDALEEGSLDALFSSGQPEGQIPNPQDGAGMGLAIARHIVSLHGGALLLEERRGGLFAVVSLPTGPLSPTLTVRTPRVEENGGISPVLMELSDVLPLSIFQMDEEE